MPAICAEAQKPLSNQPFLPLNHFLDRNKYQSWMNRSEIEPPRPKNRTRVTIPEYFIAHRLNSSP